MAFDTRWGPILSPPVGSFAIGGELVMRRIVIATMLLAGWVALCFARPAQAQLRYEPRRPTLSPYLNYFRLDPGPVDPYFSYLVPQRRLQGTLAGQSALIRRQESSIRSLQSRFTQFQQGGPVAPTGLGSAFGNYSSYYPGLQMGGASGLGRFGYSRPSASPLSRTTLSSLPGY